MKWEDKKEKSEWEFKSRWQDKIRKWLQKMTKWQDKLRKDKTIWQKMRQNKKPRWEDLK